MPSWLHCSAVTLGPKTCPRTRFQELRNVEIRKHRPRRVVAVECHVVAHEYPKPQRGVDDRFLNRQSKVVEARKLLPVMHLCKDSRVSVQTQTMASGAGLACVIRASKPPRPLPGPEGCTRAESWSWFWRTSSLIAGGRHEVHPLPRVLTHSMTCGYRLPPFRADLSVT